jgi:hypothetical protein
MLSSPSTSPPNVPFALLSCVLGVFFIVHGIKAIIRRETKARMGRSGPYQVISGKYAIQMGMGIIMFGLFWLALGIVTLAYLYRSR